MIYRCYSHEEVDPVVTAFANDYNNEWLDERHNIAFSDGHENIALFTYERAGVYSGHYFYKTARGEEAFMLSKEALYRIFNYHDAMLLFGLVPIKHSGSKRLTQRLGFTSQGEVEDMELFTLTKKEYEAWAV